MKELLRVEQSKRAGPGGRGDIKQGRFGEASKARDVIGRKRDQRRRRGIGSSHANGMARGFILLLGGEGRGTRDRELDAKSFRHRASSDKIDG